MPQERRFTTNAARQAAYRDRRAPGPGGPSTPATPGHKPWRRLAGQENQTLILVLAEMQAYYDTRSERWQEGDKAAEFEERLETLTEIQEQLDGWNATDRPAATGIL